MNTPTTLYRTTRAIWFFFSVIEALLLLRFVLKLFGANAGAPFTELIYGITAFFIAPFLYVFGTPAVGGSVIEFSTLLAMLVYWLLAIGIIKLVAMNRPIPQTEAARGLEEQDHA